MASLVSNVTETMLGIAFEPVEDGRPAQHLTWRTALLHIPGKHPLTVGLSSDEGGCTKLGAAMFAVPPDTVDGAMMSDSLCELVNMTAGLLKGALALDQPLGLPHVLSEADPRIVAACAGPNVTLLRAKELGLMLWVFEGAALEGKAP